jgi:hypothetical protein
MWSKFFKNYFFLIWSYHYNIFISQVKNKFVYSKHLLQCLPPHKFPLQMSYYYHEFITVIIREIS